VIKSGNLSEGKITLREIMVPYDIYWSNLQELIQHKKPSFVSFITKPGGYVVLIFWIMYATGLIYYSGKDRIGRNTMTKSQNRDDLAEMKDNEI